MLFGLAHAIFLWDGDILLAYGLIGLVCWRMIREAKETFQLLKTGVVLYLIGVAVLLLLGFVSHGEPGNFWLPGVAELQYEKFWKLQGGFEAWRSRADLLSSSLLAIGAQYGWELAGLMLFGAGLMRSGWLRGSYSSGYYLRQAAWLLPLSVLIQLPAVALQWQVTGTIAGAVSCCRCRASWAPRCRRWAIWRCATVSGPRCRACASPTG